MRAWLDDVGFGLCGISLSLLSLSLILSLCISVSFHSWKRIESVGWRLADCVLNKDEDTTDENTISVKKTLNRIDVLQLLKRENKSYPDGQPDQISQEGRDGGEQGYEKAARVEGESPLEREV